MEIIVATAIVGTDQRDGKEISTGTPIDQLAQQLPAENLERNLLLAAGALAIYCQAGQKAEDAPPAPPTSPPEHLPACTPAIALLFTKLLASEYDSLLPEALSLLKQASQRLPHSSLPEILSYGARKKEIRATLIPALGERGCWLSQFNPAWSWVAQFLVQAEGVMPDDAETIWQEGTLGQRREILQRLRSIDPAKAREWLMEVWKQEKASTRIELLSAFEGGLSLEDEPFLDNVMNDRAETVRTAAASLLAILPGSALVQRMIARANRLLSYTNGTLTVTLPRQSDPDWQRDSAVIPLTLDLGEETSALIQILPFIPPSYWEQRFTNTPEALIKAADNTNHSVALVSAWSAATLRYRESQWFSPLWHWWMQRKAHPMQQKLAIQLSRQQAEAGIMALPPEADMFAEKVWANVLPVLPQPWSKSFGAFCLRAMRRYLHTVTRQKMQYHTLLLTLITTTSTALPADCFEEALKPWEMEEAKSWITHYWQQHLDLFMDRIRIRKQMIEEIR